MLTFVWQQGHGTAALFSSPATGAVTLWVPLAVFALLSGLSTDYEVFIRCLAFIALGGVPVTDVKILSAGLAAGIIIDATIIRGIPTPPSLPTGAAPLR